LTQSQAYSFFVQQLYTLTINEEVSHQQPSKTRFKMSEVPAEHPLGQVSPNPYLALSALSGWVTLGDHLIFVQWDLKKAESISSGHKELCERVSAEAARMKGQTQVSIR